VVKPFSTLPSFFRRTSKKIDTNFDRLVQRSALAGGKEAVRATRVDTGKARSNWIANINAPNPTVRPPYSPGNRLGMGETANAAAAVGAMKTVISTFNASTANSIFISNFVDYIGILNDGGPHVGPGDMAAKGALTVLATAKGGKVLKRERI
jgi:hypothetical protein